MNAFLFINFITKFLYVGQTLQGSHSLVLRTILQANRPLLYGRRNET